MDGTAAGDSSSSRQIRRWDLVRDFFGFEGVNPLQPTNDAERYWDTVCSVILPQPNEPEAFEEQQGKEQEPEGKMCRTNCSSNDSPTPPPVGDAMKEPADETSSDAIHTPPTEAEEASTDSAVATVTQQSEATMSPSGSGKPTESGIAWGSAEEVEALNKDIEECLEIEGVASPASFFPETVEDFPSVGHYYIEVMNRLDAAGIDLFESFVGHLGEDHPLVKSMIAILPERKPQTFLVREPTVARDERQQEAMGIVLPGLQEFSDECRTFSWVIRTGERSVPPPEPSGRNRIGGLSVIESVTGGSQRDPVPVIPDNISSSVVCPLGENYRDLSQPQPQPSVIVTRKKRSLPTIWTRFRSCFCFATT